MILIYSFMGILIFWVIQSDLRADIELAKILQETEEKEQSLPAIEQAR